MKSICYAESKIIFKTGAINLEFIDYIFYKIYSYSHKSKMGFIDKI